ncbi:CoA-binding protein [Candidatus Uhrbacteria bacterium]|nr:CoA-binding protein [Candidatus Uhrbacteria bacterium]
MIWESFSTDTPVLIQGMTGKEGQRMAKWLIASGVNVVAGVTPGKGGQEVEGRPVFNTVAEARTAFPDVTVTSIVIPPARVVGAVEEAVQVGIRYLHILTEQVPVHDVMRMKDIAHTHRATILGPSSVGYLQFPQFRIGYLGGESPFETVKEGGTAIVSTSGGMTNELMMALSRNGIGVRVAFALGGDRVVGTTLEEAISWCEEHPEVASLALFVEPGRPFLNALCDGSFVFKKPAVVFLAGEALDDLPRGLPYGHTGTMLGEGELTVRETRQKLRERGIMCVATMSEFIHVCKEL